jgi:hypothetical protein
MRDPRFEVAQHGGSWRVVDLPKAIKEGAGYDWGEPFPSKEAALEEADKREAEHLKAERDKR